MSENGTPLIDLLVRFLYLTIRHRLLEEPLPDPMAWYPAAVGAAYPETSSMGIGLDEPGFASQRRQILDALYDAPDGMLNNTELGVYIDRNVSTAAVRTKELRQMGWVEWLDSNDQPILRPATNNRSGRAQWLTVRGRYQWKQRMKEED